MSNVIQNKVGVCRMDILWVLFCLPIAGCRPIGEWHEGPQSNCCQSFAWWVMCQKTVAPQRCAHKPCWFQTTKVGNPLKPHSRDLKTKKQTGACASPGLELEIDECVLQSEFLEKLATVIQEHAKSLRVYEKKEEGDDQMRKLSWLCGMIYCFGIWLEPFQGLFFFWRQKPKHVLFVLVLFSFLSGERARYRKGTPRTCKKASDPQGGVYV